MSDNTLTTLMGGVPTRLVVRGIRMQKILTVVSYFRCILLLEDLDAAFTRSVSRDSTSTGTPTVNTKEKETENDGSTLSLSGLLNSLDGVAAAEGR